MTQPLRRIVVGSSLAPQSDGVLSSALAFARLVGAQVEVVHAYVPPMPYIGDPFPVAWASDELLADHEAALERALAAQAERVHARPGEIGGFRLTPAPPDRLLRHSGRPILLARSPFLEVPRQVLLPVDFSRPSMDALAWGGELLRAFGEPNWPAVEALFVLSPFPDQTELQFTSTQVERLALDELDRALGKLKSAGAMGATGAIGRRIRIGRPSEEILAEIHDRAVDLVILGTHGRSGLERFMLGSVASDITRDARCSVIIVPPAAG